MHVIISFMMTINWNDVLMGYPHQQLYIQKWFKTMPRRSIYRVTDSGKHI